MKMAIAFSRRNDAVSRAHTTKYSGENLVLAVVFLLESKALYFLLHRPLSQGFVGSTDKREARAGDDGNERKAGAARFPFYT